MLLKKKNIQAKETGWKCRVGPISSACINADAARDAPLVQDGRYGLD